MSYATPAAFEQALEARLRAEAAATGRDLARVRQLLVFERFLSRVVTAFGDVVVLKGGVVLELRRAHDEGHCRGEPGCLVVEVE